MLLGVASHCLQTWCDRCQCFTTHVVDAKGLEGSEVRRKINSQEAMHLYAELCSLPTVCHLVTGASHLRPVDLWTTKSHTPVGRGSSVTTPLRLTSQLRVRQTWRTFRLLLLPTHTIYEMKTCQQQSARRSSRRSTSSNGTHDTDTRPSADSAQLPSQAS